jgi:ComF family protein
MLTPKTLPQKILSLIFPITCSNCGSDLAPLSKTRICQKCKSNFPKIEGLICHKCGVPLDSGGQHCYTCLKKPKHFAFDKMRSVYKYEGSIRSLILKFKYSNRFFLDKDFAQDLATLYNSDPDFQTIDFIVPVPLNIIRRFNRGYNQAALLANELGKIIGKPVLNNVLFRKKITKPQFKLSKKQREANLANSFYALKNPLIFKKKILLIDDIATTSTTASLCAAELKKSSVKKVYVLTLSRD